jgi:hypothetical protein
VKRNPDSEAQENTAVEPGCLKVSTSGLLRPEAKQATIGLLGL